MTAAARLSAFAALGRGFANLRGNWPLAIASVVAMVVLTVGIVVSVVPLLLATGLEVADLAGLADDPQAVEKLRGFDPTAFSGSQLLVGLLVLLGGLVVTSLFYAWFQAGAIGVLSAGDAQAPPGPGRSPEYFRTWSGRDFVGQAGRLFGRVLGFWALWLGLWILWLLVLAGVVLAGAWGASRWGGGAALAIGCGGALPVGFSLLAMALAMNLGQADLARADGSAAAAVGVGFRVLSARLGAALGLWLLFFCALTAWGLFAGGLGWAAGVALADQPAAVGALTLVRFLFDMLVNSVLTLALLAASIALVRGERARSLNPEPVA